nr:hypothetical protein [Methylorubrum zatmanii]
MPLFVSRTVGAAFVILICASGATHAESKLDPQLREESGVRGEMRSLHQNMILAERNLSEAIKQRDNLRLLLVSGFLGLTTSKPAASHHSCAEAEKGLNEAVAGAVYALNPRAMTVKIDDEKSINLLPEQDALFKWYEDGRSKYASNLSDCEEQVGIKKTERSMPERLPWAN